ncbi:hypothetical protein ND16A_3682, partial [Thalassotalea sp. ND16A]
HRLHSYLDYKSPNNFEAGNDSLGFDLKLVA